MLCFCVCREARDFSAEVLRGLVSARKVVATIPIDLPQSDVIFDDEVDHFWLMGLGLKLFTACLLLARPEESHMV